MQERRRAALEAQKAKVAELRKRREERERGTITPASSSTTAPGGSRRDLDALINSLVSPRSPRSSTPVDYTVPSTPTLALTGLSPSGRASRASDRGSDRGLGAAGTSIGANSGRVSRGSDTGSDLPGQGRVLIVPESTIESSNPTEPATTLLESATSLQAAVPIARYRATDRVIYSRGVQTVIFEEEPSGPSEDDIRHRIQAELEAVNTAREQRLEEENDQIAKEIEDELQDLTEDERATILTAPEFLNFVEQSSKIIQRALSDAYDYTRDYTIGTDAETPEYENKRVKLICAFSDEQWTKNRSITDIDWSPKYPELIAASYNKNSAAPNDPDGIVAVWNMHLVDRPEFVFHSQSDVLSVTFSPFHPNLIFGGTYSGQILLWDTRSKHLPILKTPLSAAGHTYPVYAMSMVGTQNAHNLITTSTDGMVCSWLVDMLAQPQETLELVHSGHNKTNEVAITTFDFPDNETASFWVGTEEGNVYQANRYDRAGSKAGLNPFDIYKAHSGPVTGLHFHPLVGPVDFSDIFLTSSVDWTVKLWKAKSITKPSNAISAVAPLYSFEEADDYIYDVKWHPNHPAVFGAVDGSGRFDLWNLNIDTEVPITKTQVGSGRAINKLAWDRKDGRRAALGSSDGKLYIYDVGDAGVPRDSEWLDLQKTISSIVSGAAQGSLSGDIDARPFSPITNGR